MESVSALATRSFTTLIIFCLALSSWLLSRATSHAITPSGGEALAPSAAQAITPPLAAPVAASPSVEDPAAPSLAPAVATTGAAQPVLPSGTIKRLTKQQILATIPPGPDEGSEPFLSSPSGKYTGYLLRRGTAPASGGFGNDFCYIQVRDTSTGQSVWESVCVPASLANACCLLFTEAGLEVFDGSRSAWDAGAEAQHLETLELVDEGDMRIRTRDGELAWKASDQPLANQQCGLPGSPGLGSAKPPFAGPIEDSRNLPFGLPSQGNNQQQQQQSGTQFIQKPLAGGFAKSAGDESGQQALIDNTPFDSASWRVAESWFMQALALALALVSCASPFEGLEWQDAW